MNHSRGLDPVIEAYKKDVDRTLIRKNLKLSHEERLQNAMQLQRFAHELQKAGHCKPWRILPKFCNCCLSAILNLSSSSELEAIREDRQNQE